MSYINKSLERKFLKMSSSFKAVMVTGARQVGKSTRCAIIKGAVAK